MFKKSLSVALACLMVVLSMSTMIFTTSATAQTPEGTGINSLSEITDMAGKYYLKSDIGSVDALSSTTISSVFTGTLDGNGKTIYTSVAVFKQLGNGATVTNLTLDGNIPLNYHGGALAVLAGVRGANSSITLKNVVNKADVVQNSTGVATAGLIGYLYGAINATNCENYGTISTKENSSGYQIVGGLVGKVADGSPTTDTVFEGCKNRGAITINTSSNYIILGGLVGQMSLTNNTHFVFCENSGALTATPKGNISLFVGGIVGKETATTANYTYINCKNNQTITVDSTLSNGMVYVGGVAAGEHNVNVKAYRCENKGNISVTGATGATSVAGIVPKCSAVSKFVFCVNSANISGPEGKTAQIAPVGEINNYAKGVTDVSFKGVQRSVEVKNGEYALRFVSEITDTSKYSNTGLVVYYMRDGKAVKYTNQSTNTVYAQINALSNGVNTPFPTTVTAGKYYSAITVTNIPVSGTYEFIVVPYTTDLEGNCVYSDAYTVTVTDGVLASPVAFN